MACWPLWASKYSCHRSAIYVIAAKAQRRVFDSTEEYYWLIWVSLDGQESKQVMLTNKNLMGDDSPDCVFKVKDLIPTGITEN